MISPWAANQQYEGSSGYKMLHHMMSYMLKITRVRLLVYPVKSQQQMWLLAAWSPSTVKGATSKGTRSCHQFTEVMAFRVTLEHAQKHQWPHVCIYSDSWVITKAVQKWFKDWNHDNQQQWGKPLSAAEEQKVIQQLLGETSAWTQSAKEYLKFKGNLRNVTTRMTS